MAEKWHWSSGAFRNWHSLRVILLCDVGLSYLLDTLHLHSIAVQCNPIRFENDCDTTKLVYAHVARRPAARLAVCKKKKVVETVLRGNCKPSVKKKQQKAIVNLLKAEMCL